MVRDEDRC